MCPSEGLGGYLCIDIVGGDTDGGNDEVHGKKPDIVRDEVNFAGRDEERGDEMLFVEVTSRKAETADRFRDVLLHERSMGSV